MIKAPPPLPFNILTTTRILTNQLIVCRFIPPNSPTYNSLFRSISRQEHYCRSKLVSNSFSGSFDAESSDSEYETEGEDDDYLEAFVLISEIFQYYCCLHGSNLGGRVVNENARTYETIRHHHMRGKGFQDKFKWHPSGRFLRPIVVMDPIGPELLRRFHNPTIFLKICCGENLIFPITVGEYAVEKLIDSLHEDENGDLPSQFQLIRNIVTELGYEVKMVRITERVVNTYCARIFFHKPGEKDILKVDARPSDAINIARRCKAPLYVNRKIVLVDAVRTDNWIRRIRDSKSVYDASLDSAADGTDLIAQELHMVRNMKLAIKEERYSDAVMWRDKLVKLRDSIGGC